MKKNFSFTRWDSKSVCTLLWGGKHMLYFMQKGILCTKALHFAQNVGVFSMLNTWGIFLNTNNIFCTKTTFLLMLVLMKEKSYAGVKHLTGADNYSPVGCLDVSRHPFSSSTRNFQVFVTSVCVCVSNSLPDAHYFWKETWRCYYYLRSAVFQALFLFIIIITFATTNTKQVAFP